MRRLFFIFFMVWPIAALSADEVPHPANAAAASGQAPVEKADEEFKIRYKRLKQRHDDDEAPVPKIVRPAPVEAPTAAEK